MFAFLNLYSCTQWAKKKHFMWQCGWKDIGQQLFALALFCHNEKVRVGYVHLLTLHLHFSLQRHSGQVGFLDVWPFPRNIAAAFCQGTGKITTVLYSYRDDYWGASWLKGLDEQCERPLWTGAVFCSLEQKAWLSGHSVCRDWVAVTCKGWGRGHCWELGQTSQPR